MRIQSRSLNRFAFARRLFPLGAGAVLLVLLWQGSVSAQTEPANTSASQAAAAEQSSTQRADARRVAAEVQSFYDQTSSLSTRFQQTYFSKLYNRYERSRGQLVLDKPGRLRFDYSGNGQVIVSDGQEITMFQSGDDGQPGQVMRAAVSDASIPGAFAFLTGTARLDRDYDFELLDSSRYRYRGHVLELRPKQPDPRYKRVLLFVDSHPDRRGVIHRIRIDDHEGNRNKFTFARQRFNQPVAPERFAFTPPPGTIEMAH